MPIYEYICNQCRKKTSVFTRSVSSPSSPVCQHCGAMELTRAISTFAHHKSEQTIREEAGEPKLFQGPDYYKDPRNIGRWVEKRMGDMGVEMPSQVRTMIDAAREGELPEPVKDI